MENDHIISATADRASFNLDSDSLKMCSLRVIKSRILFFTNQKEPHNVNVNFATQ